MTDSMQFGPEWLRNLSHQDGDDQHQQQPMVMPRFQLAEHRYGREEMLALFDKTTLAPDPLRTITGLFVDKIQLPLALIQSSEEETRAWNMSINSDNNSRTMMKNMNSTVSNIGLSGGNMGGSRGRGISVDRGRGRTTRTSYHYNSRHYSEEGSEQPYSGASFGRPRMFDRSQSHPNEKSWNERNGSSDYNDWNGYNCNNNNSNSENGLSTSPRKDFGNSLRLNSREETNWRRRPAKDDEEGWRSSRHGRGYTNWREGSERDREKEKESETQDLGKDRRWMSRVVSMHSHSNRRNSENRDDILPEWATENPSEGGGTFDSSGAFRNTNSDDDDDDNDDDDDDHADEAILKKVKRKTEKNDEVKKVDTTAGEKEIHKCRVDRKPASNESKKMSKEKPITSSHETSQIVKSSSSPPAPALPSEIEKSFSQSIAKDNSQKKMKTSQQAKINQQVTGKELSGQISGEFGSVSNIIKSSLDDGSQSSQSLLLSQTALQRAPPEHKPFSQLQQPKLDLVDSGCARGLDHFDSGYNFIVPDNSKLMRMNSVMVQCDAAAQATTSLTLDNQLLVDAASNSVPLLNHRDSANKIQLVSHIGDVNAYNMTAHMSTSGKEEELHGIVGDVVSKIMAAEEEEKEKLKKLELCNKWFYRDPQGVVQGSFSHTEMAEWYRLGYFHDKSLIVRRACDASYYSLHDLVTYLGGSPFETVTLQNFDKYMRIPLRSVQLSVSNPVTIPPPPITPNVPDESLLLQHVQSPYELYARQQFLAAKKRQLPKTQEGLKTFFEQQRLMTQQHLSNSETAPPSTIPLIPGYVHPILPPNLSSTDPNLVLLINQMQQQQQHQHQIQQQFIQQQLHQQQQHQQLQSKDIKQERLQQTSGLLPQLDLPLQTLVHKMGHLPVANQMPIAQTQNNGIHSNLPTLPVDPISQTNIPTAGSSDGSHSSTAIQTLLKQLGVSTEKHSKFQPNESFWKSNPDSSTSSINSKTFNAQHWCSQVGKIGPSNNASNNGLWTTEGLPPTTAMKTEQEIIESFMRSMQHKEEGIRSLTEVSEKLKLIELEETKLAEAKQKEKEEERRTKREEEKYKRKKQEEEEKLRRIEEEQRRKAVEDAKRKEEERKRKEEEKRNKKDDDKGQERKAEEDKKKLDQQQSKEAKELNRKAASESLKRLKEQQVAATRSTTGGKTLQKVASGVANAQAAVAPAKVQKTVASKQLAKSTSGQLDDRHKNSTSEQHGYVESPKTISKSKSTPSVPAQAQKQPAETEKKEKKKKEKNASATNAWADQKKITNVKSLAEIQAEEQKKLDKQIEKEKQERLLQQQAAATANTVKETANLNIWKSQTVPWKHNWPSANSSGSANNSGAEPASASVSKTTTVSNGSCSRVLPNLGGGQGTAPSKPTNSNATNKQASSGGSVLPTSSGSTPASVRNKSKREDASSKKAVAHSQAMPKNDELSKWGVKALSNLKQQVDVPTFIDFLRDVESPNDVMDYVTDYLGDSKEIKIFVKQFLEKRSALGAIVGCDAFVTSTTNARKSKKKTDTSDGVSSSTAATKGHAKVGKTGSDEFVEVKGKAKKAKKKPVLKLDSALLGFNVTAAPNRINIGDLDYGEDVY